jgi:ubiquinone/menaquinone biosynthesis C-methylase UbiE
MIDDTLSRILRCPDCHAELIETRGELACTGCGQAFSIADGIPDLLGRTDTVNQDEVATQDHVSDFYEEQRYHKAHSRAFHHQSVADMVRMVRLDGLVLDNGCGNGFLADVCRDIAPAAQLVGIDISHGMLDFARKHHTRLVRGDSTRLPFADETFDTIFARSLLHHLPDPEAGVREMARVLKPGGELVVLDTHKTVISALPRAIANRGEHFDEDHKNFRTRELTSVLERHLAVDRVEYMGYVAYPLLGFPDLYDFSKFLPMKALARPLLGLDRLLATVPVVRRLGWGIVVKAHRAAA